MSHCTVFKSCYLLVKFSITGVRYFNTWQIFWIYFLALFVWADVSVLLNCSPIWFGGNRKEVWYEVWQQSATQQHEWLEQKYQTVTWVCIVNKSLRAEFSSTWDICGMHHQTPVTYNQASHDRLSTIHKPEVPHLILPQKNKLENSFRQLFLIFLFSRFIITL